MESDILANVNGHIFRNVQGFYNKYFQPYQNDSAVSSKVKQWLSAQLEYTWSFPDSHVQKSGLGAWIELFGNENNTSWDQHLLRDLHVLRVELKAQTSSIGDDGMFTRALGVHTSSEAQFYGNAIGVLCSSARDVFRKQPTRPFLHAFLLSGRRLELWVFDRAGLYCCTPYDVWEEPERFANAMYTYTYLCGDQLGRDTFSDSLNGVRRVFTDEESLAKGIQPLYLDPEPLDEGSGELISEQPIVFFAGASHSSPREFVVKFKWRRDFDSSEGEFLESLREKQIWATVQLYHQAEVTSISKLRKGLVFGKPLELILPDILPHGAENSQDVETLFFHPSQDNRQGNGCIDRCLSCIAVYPRGTELEDYGSPIQAIEGFRDALKGHRSLYQQGRLLHRDISIFNIMLTANASISVEDAPKGFLIDIDGALDLDNPPRRNQIVGTRPFMAINLLHGQLPHTYRYDLESFLYCLVWFCISPKSTTIQPPQGSRLWRWREDDWKKLAEIKLQDMAEDTFQQYLDEFHPGFRQFQSLACNMRNHLFPIRDGKVWTGTDESDEATNSLYDALISTFEEALARTHL